jgi:hypothetical protein
VNINALALAADLAERVGREELLFLGLVLPPLSPALGGRIAQPAVWESEQCDVGRLAHRLNLVTCSMPIFAASGPKIASMSR